jgi:hypothetical protein
VVDPSRVPRDLVVHGIWIPASEASPERPLAYVTERRRRAAGGAIIALAIVIAVVVASRGHFAVAIALMLAALAAAAYAGGGKAGFYEVCEDGTLGDYRGKTPPHGFLRKH